MKADVLARLKAMSEQAPCVVCGHGMPQHQRVGGRTQQISLPGHCNECPCAFYIRTCPESEQVLIVTQEQLYEGYRCNPHVRLGGSLIESEWRPYQAIRRLGNGNYVVRAPE